MMIKHEQGNCFVKCHAGESCGEYDIGVTPETLERLRELRLWHWRQALQCRRNAKVDREGECPLIEYINLMEAHANQHIKFVQTLNDFFPVGDTAEGDAALEVRAAAADKAGI